MLREYPRPRTMYSLPANSISRPPTSLLLWRMAATTWSSGRLYAASRLGSTVIWYCFTNPPMDATSATPGTACSA